MSGAVRGAIAAVAVGAAAVCCAPAAAATAPCKSRTTSLGEWRMYGHDVANTRTQPKKSGFGPSVVAGSGLKPAWVFSTGDGSGLSATPVVYKGCVFVGSSRGVIYALSAKSGHVVWQRRLDVPNPGSGGAIVGSGAIVSGNAVVFLISEYGSPYAISLNRSTGAVIWKSQPFAPRVTGSITQPDSFTNASPIVANGYVVAGYSPPEGEGASTGGFSLIKAKTGAIVKTTPTVPLAAQADGYAGGGLWSTPAYDPETKYVYWGAGNPNSKVKAHPNTNAIIKIDVDRRRKRTFGEIVAAYQGNPEQYTQALEALSESPACSVSDNPSIDYPLDDPACGQLDLDFGASANLFELGDGRKVVGDLQKSGLYHAADAGAMSPVWTSLVGLSCQACNSASTAFDGRSVFAVGTPGGVAFALDRDTGAARWAQPIGDGVHYQSVSTADGVVWIGDGAGNLTAFEARTGEELMRRPMSLDAGTPAGNITSSGVAIAERRVFAVAGGFAYSDSPGYVIAYVPAVK